MRASVGACASIRVLDRRVPRRRPCTCIRFRHTGQPRTVPSFSPGPAIHAAMLHGADRFRQKKPEAPEEQVPRRGATPDRDSAVAVMGEAWRRMRGAAGGYG